MADALEIPYLVEPVPGATGTDAWAIQVAREGIPTGLLGIPLRYMHSAVETVALDDIDRTRACWRPSSAGWMRTS